MEGLLYGVSARDPMTLVAAGSDPGSHGAPGRLLAGGARHKGGSGGIATGRLIPSRKSFAGSHPCTGPADLLSCRDEAAHDLPTPTRARGAAPRPHRRGSRCRPHRRHADHLQRRSEAGGPVGTGVLAPLHLRFGRRGQLRHLVQRGDPAHRRPSATGPGEGPACRGGPVASVV